jgi:hypothetical protein
MAKKKLIAILDTETNRYDQEVFDIGIVIADLHGNIVDKRQWLLDEVFKTKLFYEEKRSLYIRYLKEQDYTNYVSSREGLKRLDNMLKYYNITEIYAYNMAFDSRVIKNLANELDIENPLEGYDLECLWLWSCQTIFQQKRFPTWCDTHYEYAMTEKGNFKTSAEIAYAYITNQPDFVEEHTALEDCYIEYQIFLHCRKQKKFRIKGMASQVWLLPQTEEQIEKLPTNFRTMKLNLESEIKRAEQRYKKLKFEKEVFA